MVQVYNLSVNIHELSEGNLEQHLAINTMNYSLITKDLTISRLNRTNQQLAANIEKLQEDLERHKLPFEKIANKVANDNEYALYNYNCEDFSRDLVSNLTFAGYRARTVFGKVDCDSGYFDKESCERYEGRHCWVEVTGGIFIEATSGEIIPFDRYGGVYELLRYGC